MLALCHFPSVITADRVGMLSLAGVASSNLTSTLFLASEFGCVADIAQMLKQQTARLIVYTDMGGVGMDVASTSIDIAPVSSLVYG